MTCFSIMNISFEIMFFIPWGEPFFFFFFHSRHQCSFHPFWSFLFFALLYCAKRDYRCQANKTMRGTEARYVVNTTKFMQKISCKEKRKLERRRQMNRQFLELRFWVLLPFVFLQMFIRIMDAASSITRSRRKWRKHKGIPFVSINGWCWRSRESKR